MEPKLSQETGGLNREDGEQQLTVSQMLAMASVVCSILSQAVVHLTVMYYYLWYQTLTPLYKALTTSRMSMFSPEDMIDPTATMKIGLTISGVIASIAISFGLLSFFRKEGRNLIWSIVTTLFGIMSLLSIICWSKVW